AVGDVAGIGCTALIVVEAVLDDTDGQTEEVVELAHGFGVTGGKIIVHRHDMHALAVKRIEVDRQGRHQRLAFTGAHFGNAAFVQNHAANQLHVVRTHAEHAIGYFRQCSENVGPM